MRVRLSRIATFKLENLFKYLEEEWSEKSKENFIKKLSDKIEVIKNNPKVFPESEFKSGLRKSVITKQTTLYDKIETEYIFIVTIFDNRQDQNKLKEDIRKYFQ